MSLASYNACDLRLAAKVLKDYAAENAVMCRVFPDVLRIADRLEVEAALQRLSIEVVDARVDA